MYPKDTSSEDPGPPPASDGGAGGVQTEERMRSLFQNQAQAPSSGQSSLSEASDNPNNVNITVAPFTGGPFTVKISKMETVEELKKLIARRLKVSKERIYLLYRESELVDGSVSTNLLVDGSTVTLLPRAETGLISPKPEQSVMQALESLNEQQVNDFLSGAAPLNLTMRLGDHMMLIQLQLSTVNQTSSRRHKQTIQISSASPPPYPTPPPSAPSSPTGSDQAVAPPCPGHPRKVRVPLLSPGGLYQAPPPARTSSQPSSVERSLRSGPAVETRANPATSGQGSGSCEPPAKKPKLDTKALAEASKNLTQTLKQLSSEVLTTRPESGSHQPKKEVKDPSTATRPTSSSTTASSVSTASSTSSSTSSGSSGSSGSSSTRHSRKRHSGRGAIIESMHHHGKGVYSGTFSGTLNPALQDENGQPKRDITTIVHILNDLLCAQYKAYGGTSGSSRSSKHHHHHHHHHHHKGESSKSSQNSEKQTSIFEAEARAATEKQLQEEQLNLTRHKVETLRKIMEERRAKREARRQAAAAGRSSGSYSTAWSVSEAKHGDCDKHEEGEHFLLTEPEPVTA